jgi:hypothetical protein
MLPKSEYHLRHDELKKKLLPILKEKVFHVTSFTRFEKIEDSGFIKSNSSGEFGFTYSVSENSYGRKRGYICLFDLRNKTEAEIDNGLECIYFLGARELGDKQVHLILKAEYYSKLIHTAQAKKEIRFREMWIPYVECWYPEDLPLANIEEVIIVNIIRDPEWEPIVKAMEEAIAEIEKKEMSNKVQ